MKKLLILVLTLSYLITPLFAEKDIDKKLSLVAEADMYLAYKMGVKYDISNKISLVNTFGANMIAPSQLCYSLYASVHTKQSLSSFNVDVNMGLLQGVFNLERFTESKYFYMNPGLAMHISYPVLDELSLGAQAGMVFMIGYDLDYWAYSLEPYAGITITYSK